MDEKIYGTTSDSWPFDYVVSALQLLALPEEQFGKFIPEEIEETIYDGVGGCVISSDPYVITYSLLKDYISPGTTWDEWINNIELESIGLESNFKKLSVNISAMEKVEKFSEKWKVLQNHNRNIAKQLLVKIGLYQKGSFPIFSWQEMVHG